MANSSVNATSATSSAAASLYDPNTPAAIAARLPNKVLGQDDFLKLLVKQLTSQDPLNPQKDTDFIAQMAQFSSLEQSKAMQTNMAQLQTNMAQLQASSMLGYQVQVEKQNADGTTSLDRGVVTAVQITAGKPQLLVNGDAYDLSKVAVITVPQTSTQP
jgi:flagellar basal-body rod modification protein FlgD